MLLTLLLLLTIIPPVRAYYVIKNPPKRRRVPTGTASIAVFLGSGGHTAEALTMMSALNFTRYTTRKYLVSSGDTLSQQKAIDLERNKAEAGTPSNFAFVVLPRARRVHQSLLSTPPTFIYSLLVALWELTIKPAMRNEALADVMLLNGPGTCVVVAVCVMAGRFYGLPTPRMIYVESFARVRRLSLSGKILKHIVDRFIVQWPELVSKAGPKAEYKGCFV